MYFIMVIGYGKRTVYTLRKQTSDYINDPVSGVCYKSIADAFTEADALGVMVEDIRHL